MSTVPSFTLQRSAMSAKVFGHCVEIEYTMSFLNEHPDAPVEAAFTKLCGRR